MCIYSAVCVSVNSNTKLQRPNQKYKQNVFK